MPTRTSPVLRGKWILENILNTPPPPPPPNVPTLDDSKVGQSVSLRQQLEAHRKDAVCASCHSRMDPLGLGLENFDAIGAWRAKDGQIAIDASGTLPDGRTFNGPDGLREILTSQKDMFAECVVDKMLTYALGRGLERYDRRTVREIAKKASATNYRFSSVVLEIVKSLPFEMRQGDKQGAGKTMNFVTGKHIQRRTFLRGMGLSGAAAIALPMLDSMRPAFAATTAGGAPPCAWLSPTFRTG